ncbi:MAG: Coenzyme F420 hydrogenase/dehydrogenase, beta subunit C-terminal domain [Bacteroidaceae bacterium]|nr:Coenzyme F420 hydrogenase/dehydrogenase, beta subunit C-terminal domain [Bacteroidaceae bacterium]
MSCYLDTSIKESCFGCEACSQVCSKSAISMVEDPDGFRYPAIDPTLCINCGLCRKVCLYENMPPRNKDKKYVFGGYSLDKDIRFESTSGGAFSEIVDAFCDENYVIFGAEAKGLEVYHSYITDKEQLGRFRKSKYSQSMIGNAYKDAKMFLKEGKKVLFSGTPCQIAGLRTFLGNTNQKNLLTVEVICEGVPSPLYVKKLEHHVEKKCGSRIESIDYRYTGKSFLAKGKWDFEQMLIITEDMKKRLKKDRWFNPFWSIWLKHLMSRPSCYECPFTDSERIADITLGDLWGVHIYCPELYGRNGGSSLVIGNTESGKSVIAAATKNMYGHELRFEDALKYQGPMRKHIAGNPHREQFMVDLRSEMDYSQLTKKWADKPSIKLLFQKYIWGNRQKVFIWSLFHSKGL